MKKHLKKLMAVFMAAAMTLSLSLTAFATGEEAENVARTLPTQGSADGSSSTEGPLPSDPVEVVLPVVPTPGDGEMGMFDLILDPHNLINKTEGARYAVQGVTKTFAEDQKMYFLSSSSDTAQTFGGTTQPLQIINKGRKPVNVDLSLDFTYDNTKFALVDSKAKLDPETEGAAEDAAMYMGILVGTSETATAIGEPAVGADPLFRVDGDGDYIAADGIQFAMSDNDATDEAKDELVKAISGLTLTINYADPTTEAPVDNPATADVDESEGDPVDVPATITVTGEASGEGYGITLPDDGVAATITEATGDLVVTITDGAETPADVATLTITVVKPDIKKMKAEETQTITLKAPTAGAVVQTAINAKADAYDYEWVDPATVEDESLYQGMTDAGYYWKQNPELTNADFPSITFKLTGDINGDALWDNIPVDETGISFTLTWDVMQRSSYNKDAIEFGTAEEISEGGAPVVTGNQPTVSANKMTSSSKNLTITWTKGTGSYASYTPSATVTTSNGKTLNMTASTTETGGTLYLANAYATVASNGATATVTFTASGKQDITLTTTALR